jgi:hypothetical protein
MKESEVYIDIIDADVFCNAKIERDKQKGLGSV